jgi:versiconal hemiacetal acetate esterase
VFILRTCLITINTDLIGRKDSVGASPQDPEFFIINSANFDKFPATYLAVCDVDPIRDDGLIIHDALNKAGYLLPLLYLLGC